jgi:hypothetical protein
MLLQIPVYAVMVEDLGERGAHFMAYKEFCKEMHEPTLAIPLIVESSDANRTRSSSTARRNSDSARRSGAESELSSSLWPTANLVTMAFFGMSLLSSFVFGTFVVRRR